MENTKYTVVVHSINEWYPSKNHDYPKRQFAFYKENSKQLLLRVINRDNSETTKVVHQINEVTAADLTKPEEVHDYMREIFRKNEKATVALILSDY